MTTTTKKALIDRIAIATQERRNTVRRVIQRFLDEMVAEIGRGNRLEFREFGVFEIRMRAARMAQNPKTLTPVPIPARRTVRFKMGRQMREQLGQVAAEAPAARSRSRHNGQVEIKTKPRSKVGV